MKRSLALLIAWLISAAAAAAAQPFARVTIDNDGPIVPGQQVHLNVDIFTEDFFTSPPQFPLFDIPGAVVTLPQERAQNLVETIDGVQYTGISRAYVVVPQTAGTFAIPPAVIEFGYSEGGKTVRGTAALPPVQFTVGDTPGSTQDTLPFAARGLVISQSFDRDPATLMTGDALVRTITVFAGDTQAMMIPAPGLGDAKGLKIYAKPPVIADNVEQDDGTSGSSRIQVITYTADTAGTFEIPGGTLAWFDADAQAAKIASLPATKVTVAEAPVAAEGIAPELQDEGGSAAPAFPWKRVVAITLAAACLLAAAVWSLRRLLPLARTRFSQSRAARQNSEKACFARLTAAVQKAEAAMVYHQLEVWAHSAGFRTISDWVRTSNDAKVAYQIAALERALFSNGQDKTFDRRALLDALTTGRRGDRQPIRANPAASLPPLNPVPK